MTNAERITSAETAISSLKTALYHIHQANLASTDGMERRIEDEIQSLAYVRSNLLHTEIRGLSRVLTESVRTKLKRIYAERGSLTDSDLEDVAAMKKLPFSMVYAIAETTEF